MPVKSPGQVEPDQQRVDRGPGFVRALKEAGGETPPWGDPGSWNRVNGGLAAMVRGLGERLEPAYSAAQEVCRAMEAMIPVWEELCALTYATCRDNCCTASRVWFEYPDLLLFHLLGLAIPPGQTRSDLTQPCRYLTPMGCSQPRLIRPWRCSWYLCQAQLDLLTTRPPREQRRISATLQRILDNRRRMTEAFEAALRAG